MGGGRVVGNSGNVTTTAKRGDVGARMKGRGVEVAGPGVVRVSAEGIFESRSVEYRLPVGPTEFQMR